MVIGVVDRKHTMPILTNILLEVQHEKLRMIATDLEIELVVEITDVISASSEGRMTLPGRKLLEIVRSLDDNAEVSLTLSKGNKVSVEYRKSRFVLSGFSPDEFPVVKSQVQDTPVLVTEKSFLGLIKRTAFAMAHQDVRYFLNGMLLECSPDQLRVVATDGHRLASSWTACAQTASHLDVGSQVILPRKVVVELLRLLSDREDLLDIRLGKSHVRFQIGTLTFTSQLLDGRYPDYHRVIPREGSNQLVLDRELFKSALARAAILSNEKFRGIRLQLTSEQLILSANNPEHEEAQDVLDVQYDGDAVDIGFNVGYLLDVLNVMECQQVRFVLSNGNTSAIVKQEGSENDAIHSLFVVMPVRL
jgi:DNA polymerase-3 subunit beta